MIQTLNYQGAYGNPTQEVMRNNQLSISARGLYAYLATFAGKEKVCFPSIYTIFKEFGIGKNTFYKYINELEEAGIVERTRRFVRPTIYKLLDRTSNDNENSSDDKNESENMDNTISETSNISISDDLVKAISKILTTENKQESNNNKNMNITKESKKKDEMKQTELATYIHQE